MKVRDMISVLESSGWKFEETEQLIKDAIPFHIQGLVENGDAVPEPSTSVEFVDA